MRRKVFLTLLTVCLSLLLGCLGLFALMSGVPHLSPDAVWQVLLAGRETNAQSHLVIWDLRLPRFLLGMLAGMALALAGVILQGTMRNEIAGPELIGVSSGAAVVIAAIVVWNVAVPFTLLPWLALVGGLIGGGVTLFATRHTLAVEHIALVGASVSALGNALIIAMISLGAPQQTNLIFVYLLGSLANRTWAAVWLVLPWLLTAGALALLSARILNALQLGDEVAEGLGIRVVQARLLLLLLSIALVSAVIAVCGPVAYIALLVPHLARRILQTTDARSVLPFAALLGAVLLVAADGLAHTVLAPIELPVGAWTTILGGPLLLVLLRKRMHGKGY